jgi:predicted acetyltransferase
MIDNYSSNPKLFDSCLDLLNEAFPGCKDFALKGIKYNACWNKISTPFILKEKEEIIAHAGVWPINFILNGKEHRSASIHGVCVKQSYRNRGYFQQLMQEVMAFSPTYIKNIPIK